MKTLLVTTGVLSLALAACGYNKDNYNNQAAYNDEGAVYNDTAANYSEGGNYTAQGSNTTTTAYNWPEGARIVVDNGVTYRVMPNGTRVELGPNDSRIVVENGVTYRVDPGGARVRINDKGVAVDVVPPKVDTTVTNQ